MKLSRRALCIVYGVIAVIALIGTWGNNVAYLHLGFIGANLRFWQETLVNPASRSITVDILMVGLVIFVWMFLEARRLGMRGIWLYLVFSMLVAISAGLPIFMIHRERVLAKTQPQVEPGRLEMGDAVGLMALAVCFVAYALLALHRTHG